MKKALIVTCILSLITISPVFADTCSNTGDGYSAPTSDAGANSSASSNSATQTLSGQAQALQEWLDANPEQAQALQETIQNSPDPAAALKKWLEDHPEQALQIKRKLGN